MRKHMAILAAILVLAATAWGVEQRVAWGHAYTRAVAAFHRADEMPAEATLLDFRKALDEVPAASGERAAQVATLRKCFDAMDSYDYSWREAAIEQERSIHLLGSVVPSRPETAHYIQDSNDAQKDSDGYRRVADAALREMRHCTASIR